MNACGIWFYSLNTSRYLYLMRNDPKHLGTWGLPGGKCQSNETLFDTIKRECEEELGYFPEYIKLVPLEQFTSNDNKFVYHTFFCCVVSEFMPKLNKEHLGYAWIDSLHWPKPLHPGLWNTINFEEIQNKIDIIKTTVQTSAY